MAWKPRSSDPRVFLAAAADERRDSELRYRVTWNTHIVPAHSKYVIGLIVEVMDDYNLASNKPVLSYENSWPNSTESTYDAFLYQCYHRVARMVENWAQDRDRMEAGGRNRR